MMVCKTWGRKGEAVPNPKKSDCGNAQADFHLRRAHLSEDKFSDVAAPCFPVRYVAAHCFPVRSDSMRHKFILFTIFKFVNFSRIETRQNT